VSQNTTTSTFYLLTYLRMLSCLRHGRRERGVSSVLASDVWRHVTSAVYCGGVETDSLSTWSTATLARIAEGVSVNGRARRMHFVCDADGRGTITLQSRAADVVVDVGVVVTARRARHFS